MKRDTLISTPARRYAGAMMEVAIKQRNFMQVLEQLELFQKQMDEVPVLMQLFVNPAVPIENKLKILGDVGAKLQLLELTMNFLKTLMRRHRLSLLREIMASAEQQFLEKQGIVVVEVITARRLEGDEEKGLVAKLEAFTGKKVQLENSVDPSLIGGAITRIGTTLYDGSVTAQLEQLKQKIMQS